MTTQEVSTEVQSLSRVMAGEIVITDSQVDLIRRTIAQGASDEELQLFFYDCKRQGVHPLDKMIHFSKRRGKYVPITSIDLMRARAADTEQLAGIDLPVFSMEDGDRVARVTVYRLTQGQRFAYPGEARWSEYYPGDGPEGFMWRDKPKLMLGKCAEAQALRRGFPRELHGMYAAEEMHRTQEEERPARPIRRAAVPAITAPVEQIGDPTKPVEDADTPELKAQAEVNFPKPEEDRTWLVSEITRIGRTLGEKLSAKERLDAMETYLGDRKASLAKADVSALRDLLSWLKARAGER